MLARIGVVRWGDVATWIAAVGTVSAVVVALLQVARERKLRLHRERRDWTEQRRAHARLISAWIGSPSEDRTPVYIHNGSPEPIYEIVVGIVFVQGAAPHDLEGMLDLFTGSRRSGFLPATTSAIIPPGTWRLWIRGRGWTGVMGGRAGADVAFVDRDGVSWVRRARGNLEELNCGPLAHFAQHGLHGPHELQLPEQM